jgi:hypothetical protein
LNEKEREEGRGDERPWGDKYNGWENNTSEGMEIKVRNFVIDFPLNFQ